VFEDVAVVDGLAREVVEADAERRRLAGWDVVLGDEVLVTLPA
jgi:hypothetical protein